MRAARPIPENRQTHHPGDTMNSIKIKLLAGLTLTITVAFVIIFSIIALRVSGQSVEAFSKAASREIAQVDRAMGILIDAAGQNAAMLAASPLNAGIDETVTSYLGPEDKPRTPAPDDAYGQKMGPLLTWIKETHPSYDSVYIGTKWGGNVLSNTSGTRKSYDPRQRVWWTAAVKDASRPQVTPAYKGTTGEAMISVAKAYARGAEPVAVAAIDLTLGELSDSIASIRLGRTGYVLLVQGDGTVIANPRDKEMNFKKVGELSEAAYKRLFESGDGSTEIEIGGTAYLGEVVTSPKLGWRFIGLIEKREVLGTVRSLLVQIGVVMGVSLLVILGALFLFMDRTIVRPLLKVVDFLRTIARGEYGERIAQRRGDEIGQIFAALDEMAETLGANIAEITRKTQEAERQAREARTAGAAAEEARRRAETAKSEGMHAAAERLEAVVAHIASAAEEITQQTDEIRHGAETQSDRISSTATAMEEMNATVLEVARNSGDTAEIGASARDKAQEGAQIVRRSVEAMLATQAQTVQLKGTMDNLGRQAEAIGRIMVVIEDIADQTNLLALNAAIEAARAGDAGRGFAVVADEVRKLAEKTMTATKEVGDSIRSIQNEARQNMAFVDAAVQDMGRVVELTGSSGTVLEEIVRNVEISADRIRGIATAAEEQSATSEEINRSIDEINRITQETTRGVGQTAAAIRELSDQMLQLNGLIQELKNA